MEETKIEKLIKTFAREAIGFAKAIRKLRKTSLSYRELIEDITKSKPADSRVVQCAVLKQISDGNIELSVLFLDKDEQPVLQSQDGKVDYGFAYTLKSMDPELTELFARTDLIIFK